MVVITTCMGSLGITELLVQQVPSSTKCPVSGECKWLGGRRHVSGQHGCMTYWFLGVNMKRAVILKTRTSNALSSTFPPQLIIR